MAWNALIDPATKKFYPNLVPEGGGVALTKGQLISALADGTEVAVPVGANGTFLQAQDGNADGLVWAAVPGAVPLAKGQLLSGNAAGDATIVPAPTTPAQDGWVLTAVPGAATGLEWAPVAQAPFTGVGQMQYGGAAPDYDDTPLNLGTAGQILKVNPGATAPEWADPAGTTPFTAAGQMQYGGAGPGFADTPLNIGTPGQLLKVNAGATAPEWADVAGETIVAGAGLTITPAGTNTISINQGFLNKGDLIVGTGVNAGVIVPCPAFDQNLVLGTSATTTSGLEWKSTGGGYSGPIINRSSGIDPVEIAAPATASDTMICVADHPNDESWVAIPEPTGTNTQNDLFPFTDSAGNVYRFANISTTSPVDGSPLPCVIININQPNSAPTQSKCVFFETDPGDPQIIPSINGCFENSGIVWIYGSFDSIAMYGSPGGIPGPGPTPQKAGCVVASVIAGQTAPFPNPALTNNIVDGQGNCGITCTDFSVGGPPRINCGFYNPYFYDEGQGPYNNLVFAGYFNAQFQLGVVPVSTDMQNIIIYDTTANGPRWFDSGQMDVRKMATNPGPTGEVYSGYVQTNNASPYMVIGGLFTSVDYNPTPRAYLGVLNFPGGDGAAANWVAEPTPALTGPVAFVHPSGTNTNTALIQGAFGTFGAVGGGLAYINLTNGAATQINLASLPAAAVWSNGASGLTIALLKADPASAAVLHDVCVFNVPNVGAISYRTPCTGTGAGTWVLNPIPTGQITNSVVRAITYGTLTPPVGADPFPNPALYALDKEVSSGLKYLKQNTGGPLTAIFKLTGASAGTALFRTGGPGTANTCTMLESTAQYFMASPQLSVAGGFDWVVMGMPAASTTFSTT